MSAGFPLLHKHRCRASRAMRLNGLPADSHFLARAQSNLDEAASPPQVLQTGEVREIQEHSQGAGLLVMINKTSLDKHQCRMCRPAQTLLRLRIFFWQAAIPPKDHRPVATNSDISRVPSGSHSLPERIARDR